VKYAGDHLRESVVVFNGDVMTELDLAAVIRLHRERRARATIVLTPVDNPSAYGLVETDEEGNIRRFLEKPKPDEITTNHINAGIYVLEPDTFDRIPSDVSWSIERSYFPSLVERGETFVAYLDSGYWIDIGTPEKYMQVHRDVMEGRFNAPPFAHLPPPRKAVHPDARIEDGAVIDGPVFIDEGALVKAGARVGPYAVVGRQTQIEEEAVVERAVLWPNCRIGSQATVRDAVLGRQCHVGRNVSLDGGAVLGDKTTLTDFTRA
jgi:NDP-sugar pyrophosphorylase family protein